MESYHRYHIETKHTANLVPHPHRFHVKVKRLGLAKLLIQEFFHYRGNKSIITSRPCMYGVFSGPVGGFLPREKLCVGCLRCTVQYPEIVQITHNLERKMSGDAYFTSEFIDTVVYEAETGRIPIKGAGYRGKFGGSGWDGMWTDMSEIVRPTRDGIHGRESISTEVDLGKKPTYLSFDSEGNPTGDLPQTFSLPIPLLFDDPPPTNHRDLLHQILEGAAQQLNTLAILPLKQVKNKNTSIPLVYPEDFPLLKNFQSPFPLLEMGRWDHQFYQQLCHHFPSTLLLLRTSFENQELLSLYEKGIRIFHFTANEHGRSETGRFVLDLIRDVNNTFVKAGCRSELTLIGSGGIIAAEHIPKAIMCGLDAIALDTPLLAALQVQFSDSSFILPKNLSIPWGVQRLVNLIGAWRDQLLEILGAMGIREVRRLRGEMGRALFQKELEKEAFQGIKGYESD